MSTHNICFCPEIRKILYGYPIFIWSYYISIGTFWIHSSDCLSLIELLKWSHKTLRFEPYLNEQSKFCFHLLCNILLHAVFVTPVLAWVT